MKPTSDPDQARKAKLAAALRANLRRRKTPGGEAAAEPDDAGDPLPAERPSR